MADAALKAAISLDTAGALNPLAALRGSLGNVRGLITGVLGPLAALAGVGLTAGGALAGFKQALDLGGHLSDVAAQTGATAGEMAVLEQAFNDAGVGATQAAPAINLMQKALAGVNDAGEPTGKIFARLGLNLDDLKKKSPLEQFRTLQKTLAALPTPAERAEAAMKVFGRSGAQMLALFTDAGALDSAAQTLGGQAALLNKNAALFDRTSDLLGNAGVKVRGFFVGVADKVAPLLLPLLEKFNRLDLSGLGQQVGGILATLAAAFQQGRLSELVSLSLKAGFTEAANFLVPALAAGVDALGGAVGGLFSGLAEPGFWQGVALIALGAFGLLEAGLIKIFEKPLVALQAGMDTIVQNLMAGLARLPGMGSLVGDVQPRSFAQNMAERAKEGTFLTRLADEQRATAPGLMGEGAAMLKPVLASFAQDTGTALKTAMQSFNEARAEGPFLENTAAAELRRVYEEIRATAPKGEAAAAPGAAPARAAAATAAPGPRAGEALADRLTRIGAFIGPGGPAGDHAKRTSDGVWELVRKQGELIRALSRVNSGGLTSPAFAGA